MTKTETGKARPETMRKEPIRRPTRREWDAARFLYEDGAPPGEVAAQLGVTPGAVSRRKRAEGWARPAEHGGAPHAAAPTLRRAAALLDESARRAAREGDSARAAADAERLARLEKLIEEAETRAGRRAQRESGPGGAADDDPRSDEELRAALQERLNRMYRHWVAEALRVILRQEFASARSQTELARALQARADAIEAGEPDPCGGWPISAGDMAGGGAGFTPDPRTNPDAFQADQGRDPKRLLFGDFQGAPHPPPWEEA